MQIFLEKKRNLCEKIAYLLKNLYLCNLKRTKNTLSQLETGGNETCTYLYNRVRSYMQ